MRGKMNQFTWKATSQTGKSKKTTVELALCWIRRQPKVSRVSPCMTKFTVAWKDFTGRHYHKQLINTGRLSELPHACKSVYRPPLVKPLGRVRDI